MACMKLGSKSEVFYLKDNTWLCSTGLPSDVTVEVGDTFFQLHKFPLLSRSGVLENLIAQGSGKDEENCTLQLHDIPGGAKTFLLVAKFCYGVKVELTALNVVALRCAAENLKMTEDYGEENLITQTEHFLEEIFSNWTDTLKAFETCEEVLAHAEELHIISRCINSLAMKACADPSLFNWPVSGESGMHSPADTAFWNGIRPTAKAQSVSEDWWYEDVSVLKLPFYKRLILDMETKAMKPEKIAGSIMHYAQKYLPLMGRQSSARSGNNAALGSNNSTLAETDQRNLLEEIVELLPSEKGVTSTKFLLRLLRTSMILHSGPSCRDKLEKYIGLQLDQALLEDLLIPNMGYSVETLYDIDCVQRMLDHFMMVDNDAVDPIINSMEDDGQLMGAPHSLTPMIVVANLMDSYLAEVATDVNLKLPNFQALAAIIPDYARAIDDGIYRAIDIYLKAHPWLTDSEREQICRLMNCQKLSMEACTHAAQNERLPLRVIVQVLFFEQLRLRTSIAGWFFVSDNLENPQNPSGNLALSRTQNNPQNSSAAFDSMKDRVAELEKECMNMKQEVNKLVKSKGSWNIFRRLGFRMRSKAKVQNATKRDESKEMDSSTTPLMQEREIHDNDDLRDSA